MDQIEILGVATHPNIEGPSIYTLEGDRKGSINCNNI